LKELPIDLELPRIWPGIVVTWSVSFPFLVVLAGGTDDQSQEHKNWQQLHLDGLTLDFELCWCSSGCSFL